MKIIYFKNLSLIFLYLKTLMYVIKWKYYIWKKCGELLSIFKINAISKQLNIILYFSNSCYIILVRINPKIQNVSTYFIIFQLNSFTCILLAVQSFSDLFKLTIIPNDYVENRICMESKEVKTCRYTHEIASEDKSIQIFWKVRY